MASEAKPVKKDLNEILIEQLKCYMCKNGVKVGKHCWHRCPANLNKITDEAFEKDDNFIIDPESK